MRYMRPAGHIVPRATDAHWHLTTSCCRRLVQPPLLEDKFKGSRRMLDVLKADSRIDPGRVIIDHVEEHTVEMVLEAGFWAGLTLYPESKCTPARAIDIVEQAAGRNLWLNCACD